MKPSRSLYLEARGLKHHCRIWGRDGAPKLFLLHGIQDCSASWQFMVDELEEDWHIIAPDWRGFGLSDRTAGDTYWSPDFIADLMFILDAFEPDAPVRLVGHSLGGSVGSIYAGTFPERVARFVSVEGLGPPASEADEAPLRYTQWLDALAASQINAATPAKAIQSNGKPRRVETLESFAARLRADNPRLTAQRAAFLAKHWTRREADGAVTRLADPAHRHPRPVLWRLTEEIACWKRMQAPMLWVEGTDSANIRELRGKPNGYEKRISSFPTLVRIDSIAEAGHNVHIDQPEALARSVEKFLTEATAASVTRA